MTAIRRALYFVLAGLVVGVPLTAQQPPPAAKAPAGVDPQGPLAKEAFLTPPKEIADAVLSGRSENVSLNNLSPDGKKFLVTKTDGLPPISRLGCPCAHLAEMAFDPVAARERSVWVRSADGFELFFHADQRTVKVQVPDGLRVSHPVWSPDGSKLAFFAHAPQATYLYVANTETGESKKLTDVPVLATLVTAIQWTKDGSKVQTVLWPDDGKREAPKPNVSEPKVRVTRGGANPSRTYRYLLESSHDVRLLEHLITGQLAVIDVTDGRVTKIGEPAMIRSVSTSPEGKQFRVTTVKKPFSYYVPFTRFGSLEAVWDEGGKSLATLSERNLRETEPAPPAVATQPAGTGRFGPGARAATQPKTDPKPPTDPTDPPGPGPGPGPDPGPDAPPRFGPPVDPDGKRDITWRPDGAGFSFLQLEPAKADPKADAKSPSAKTEQKGPIRKGPPAKDANPNEPPRKDRVMLWVPPFGKDDTKVIFETPHRIASAQYTADGKMLFLTQTVDNQRQITAIDMADPKKTYVVQRAERGGPGGRGEPPMGPKDPPKKEDENEQLRGGRGAGGIGGSGLMTRSLGGANVVRVSSKGEVYVSGSDRVRGGGEGTYPKPYLDKIEITTAKKTRIFEGKGDTLETIDAVDADDVTKVFTTRQKPDVVPDSYVTELDGMKVTKLTNNVDRTPWHHKLKVQRFQVTRVDGFRFWVKVTTPPDAKEKLPALFWIYPREYTDQAAYSAGAGRGGTGATSGRFTAPGPRSMTLLTLLGYAVVEPDVPIVGPAGRMNDNYIPDLRNSLWAVIDDLDKKGIIDRDRLACGGHSYGAFSTANAMAHTPFFKAGIAGDGNYNRTLTAMSFQTERRHLWDARETYLEMSPLLWANRVNGALLMYHGMEDANVGTDPINAELLFMALDGLGKPAALYMYPYEGHGPLSKETTLDLWARWVAWLDKYVKNAKK
jgi:dipeptidyl aminopeptidase/acylaminoacyl peptidase